MERVLTASVTRRLRRLDLAVEVELGEETLALVGPSGAGKTSLLRAIAGLVHPDRGRVVHRGETWLDTDRGIDLPPERRQVGMVFQEGALFPHLTVATNVGFGVRRPDRHRGPWVHEMLERFGISGLAGAKPGSLSGGERQRVALARAVASEPVLLLLDEPLSALDVRTRARIAAELTGHLRELALPCIMVSHNFADVLGVAHRVAVMDGGRIEQTGTAADLLQAPASAFVASLTGVNFLPGRASRQGDLTEIRSSEGDATFLSTEPGEGLVAAVVSPWDVALAPRPPEGSALNVLSGPVTRVAGVGNRIRVTVGASPPIVAEVTDESVARLGIGPGVRVTASWKATGTRLVALEAGEGG